MVDAVAVVSRVLCVADLGRIVVRLFEGLSVGWDAHGTSMPIRMFTKC